MTHQRTERLPRARRALRRARERNDRLRSELRASRRALLVMAALLVGSLGVGVAAVHSGSGPEEDAVLLGTGVAGVDVGAESVDLGGPASIEPPPEAPPDEERREVQASRELGEGEASYYHEALEGRPTASGEAYRGAALTAAHRTLPLGSRVRVTNVRTGTAVVVWINDRGPFHGRRVIDLSRRAAAELDLLTAGRGQVRLELLP